MKIIPLLLSALLLSACGSVLPKGQAPSNLYTLNAPLDQTYSEAKIPVSLQVLMPQASPGLETEKIALRKGNNQIDYYAGIRWAGEINALVQSLLVQSFDNSKQLNAVSNDLVAVKEHYSLLVEIRDFQAEYIQQTPQAHVTLVVKLIKSDDNEIVSTWSYNEQEAAKADNAQQIVTAFDRAYQRASNRLTTDVLDFLAKPHVSGKKPAPAKPIKK